ncbi:MAG: hypothetical protein JXA77_18865 [Bacteroidales bacterium]|nr:hypothetical protein [Bacteroidales bacterium]MBN2821152.1 hypothetical protein [Bacteroidales bacterium]
MSPKNNTKRILASSISLFLSFIALIFAFLPFKIFFHIPAALVPGVIAMALAVYSVNLSAKFHLKKKLSSISILFSLIVVSLGIVNIFFTKTVVKTDTKFENKTIQIQEEVEKSEDLQEALEDLNEEELNELLEDAGDLDELIEDEIDTEDISE